jgi:hypothetical protein
MELIFNQNQIRIRKSIFRPTPEVKTSVKIGRNMDSSLTQLQQVETLIKTLLRLEAIKIGAYERWQPFFNEGLNFEGLIAFLRVFHNDLGFIKKLETNFKNRKTPSKSKNGKTQSGKPEAWKAESQELIFQLRAKIRELQIPMSTRLNSYST